MPPHHIPQIVTAAHSRMQLVNSKHYVRVNDIHDILIIFIILFTGIQITLNSLTIQFIMV